MKQTEVISGYRLLLLLFLIILPETFSLDLHSNFKMSSRLSSSAISCPAVSVADVCVISVLSSVTHLTTAVLAGPLTHILFVCFFPPSTVESHSILYTMLRKNLIKLIPRHTLSLSHTHTHTHTYRGNTQSLA